MTPEMYKAYEERAQFAEQQIKLLTKQINNIERRSQSGVSVGVDPSVVKALEKMKDVVIKGLLALKKSMIKAQQHSKKLEEENEALKIQNEKLHYRVKHLKKALDASDESSGKKPKSLTEEKSS
eukprot:CAMPEP_0185257754 /NCGR_PEP_ID=MMETSP1359-20130426/6787_1 /TAXON_ID=552665 /ORGANISM="Bigelowiella longifila, Strain CCMP242" /LENGTH=123 /DNA_ID=CAMNT_0027842987 /DNA_START=41 /DNA_END=412 /DNA_ORIENTATION=-